MTDQLTPWYDPKVYGQPVRVGWYERGILWVDLDYWDGKNWYVGDGKGGKSISPSVFPYRPWRGLTEPNEEKQ